MRDGAKEAAFDERRVWLILHGVRHCRTCVCTDDEACDGGCYWVDDDLCSMCAGRALAGPKTEVRGVPS